MDLKRSGFILFIATLSVTVVSAQLTDPPIVDTTPVHPVGSGFSVVKSKFGTLDISPYISIRYLNQRGLDTSYTDAAGVTRDITKRNDLQVFKVVFYFKGWLVTPKFRYFTYIWTSNSNQGRGAQVVVAGYLSYQFNKNFTFSAGIGALPSTRSLYGQFPFWLRQDARPIADEYFRASYTTGFWLQGEIVKNLYYKTMLGNNLSQLGVDAGQLDDGFNTWSSALWWTTNDYGRMGPYGDFEKHPQVATILGGSFTRSNETPQSQPGSEAPENTQIRLSDGTGIFSANALAHDSRLLKARYQMASFNGGIKFKGFSLDAEYYARWLSQFQATGQIPVSNLFDNGFSVQASAMLIDKTLQLFATGSYINGQYGKPSEITTGLNWHPFKSRMLRVNPEVMFENHSPVGYLSFPVPVGANGTAFMINIELLF